MSQKQKRHYRKKQKERLMIFRVYELLRQYFAGELDEEQQSWLDKWSPKTIVPTPKEKRKVEYITKIAKNEVFKQLGLAFEQKQQPHNKRFNISYSAKRYAVAAMLAFALISGAALLYMNYSGEKTTYAYYAAAEGEKKEILLPDGSIVSLNIGSRLRILAEGFRGAEREVWLEEGEAFFEVAKDASHPFIVHTAELTTLVKGTSFNIKAYSQLKETSVAVKTGLVEVRSKGQSFGVLNPQMQLSFNKENRQHKIVRMPSGDINAWEENRLVLREASQEELKLRLHQLYGVELVVEGGVLEGKHITASFGKETALENILESICLLHDVNYSINGKTVIIN